MPRIVTLSTGWLVPDGTSDLAGGLMLMPVGRLWGAVRTSLPDSVGILDRLRGDPDDSARLGPVVRDNRRSLLYWLTELGRTESWPAGVTPVGSHAWIAAPRTVFDRTSAIRWANLPDLSVYSDPAWLATALSAGRPAPDHPLPGATQ